MVRSPESILHVGRETAVLSSTRDPFRNLPTVPQLWEDSLDKVTYSKPSAERKSNLYSLPNRLASEECTASRTWATQSRSSDKLRDTIRKQITTIQALVKDVVLRLLGEEGRATEWITDPVEMSVIATVMIGSIANAFSTFTFQTTVLMVV